MTSWTPFFMLAFLIYFIIIVIIQVIKTLRKENNTQPSPREDESELNGGNQNGKVE